MLKLNKVKYGIVLKHFVVNMAMIVYICHRIQPKSNFNTYS